MPPNKELDIVRLNFASGTYCLSQERRGGIEGYIHARQSMKQGERKLIGKSKDKIREIGIYLPSW